MSSMMSEAPLWVLRPRTVESVSVLLEQKKLLLSEEDQLRDWRGVVEVSGLSSDTLLYQKIETSKEGHFIEIFNTLKKTPDTSLKKLWKILCDIDRFDIIDDVNEMVAEDIRVAEDTAEKKGLKLNNLAVTDISRDKFEEALTYDDLNSLNLGLPLPKYDAFILYGEDDAEIVGNIVKNLEARGLKILIKDRDMLGGVFEHTAVMTLISERCSKLLTFFTPSFFTSPHNQFMCDFAQWNQLEREKRVSGKIIPLVSQERCDIPAHLSLYSKIKYDPETKLYDFWERLVKNINPAAAQSSLPPPVPSAPSISKLTQPEKTKPELKTRVDKSEKLKTESTSKKLKLNIAAKVRSTKESFSNILVRDDLSPVTPLSEPSSLESELHNGDSGALLLPDVPDHEPGAFKSFFSKLGVKSSKKSKTKYKEAPESAC